MIFLPLLAVMGQLAVEPVWGEVRRQAAGEEQVAAIRREVREAMAVNRGYGLVVQQVVGRWWLREGMLTEAGAEALGGESGQVAQVVTQMDLDDSGFALGLVRLGSGPGKVRVYVEGPKALPGPVGRMQSFSRKDDDGPWYGMQGAVAEDGTVDFSSYYPNAVGEVVSVKFGPRVARFSLAGLEELRGMMRAGEVFPDFKAEEAAADGAGVGAAVRRAPASGKAATK